MAYNNVYQVKHANKEVTSILCVIGQSHTSPNTGATKLLALVLKLSSVPTELATAVP